MYIQNGETIDYKNTGSTKIAYGDVVSLTTRIGVAGEDIAAGATGSLPVTGVFELPATTSVAFSVGDTLYWNTTSKTLTKTNTDIPAGWCVEAKATSRATGKVKIG